MNYKIKSLIGDVDDSIIEIYISRAILIVKRYINNDRFDENYIKENFEDAVVAIVENIHSSKDIRNIKSFTEGKQSTTFADSVGSSINSDIRMMLPTPYVRVM